MNRADIPSAETAVGKEEFRFALSRFATGVAVVTMRDGEGHPFAITVNAFTSVSLDPPLVLFCLGKSSFNHGAFAGADAFAINFLGADQRALSDRFAQEAEDRFPDLKPSRLVTGSPILPECLGALDCSTETRHEAGDHLIIIGRVVAVDMGDDRQPLVYFGSRYSELKPRDDG